MGKIVAWEFVTLDGVIEAPDKWQFSTGLFTEEMQKAALDLLLGTDALLLGRVTYDVHTSMLTETSRAYSAVGRGGSRMSEGRPRVDDRDPGEAIEQMVEHVLGLAETWLSWDGGPISSGLGRYTPHKAIRRVADHMIDHLAQLEAHLTGVPSFPDEWHGSAITTDADMAPFRKEDLDEARSRLRRLAQVWQIRLRSVPAKDMDTSEGDAYTPREIAFCAVESGDYADAIGSLGVRA